MEEIKNNSIKSDFSGRIFINKGKHVNQRRITLKSTFFLPNEYIIVKWDNEKIIFRKPQIDYQGRTYKLKLTKSGWLTTQIVADLPIVKDLKFDLDESTIDERVVYYQPID
jgi:hypothetical protein